MMQRWLQTSTDYRWHNLDKIVLEWLTEERDYGVVYVHSADCRGCMEDQGWVEEWHTAGCRDIGKGCPGGPRCTHGRRRIA